MLQTVRAVGRRKEGVEEMEVPRAKARAAVASWVGSMWEGEGPKGSGGKAQSGSGRGHHQHQDHVHRFPWDGEDDGVVGRKVVGSVQAGEEVVVLTLDDVWNALWEGRQELSGKKTEVIPDFNSDSSSGHQKPDLDVIGIITPMDEKRVLNDDAKLADSGQKRVHFAAAAAAVAADDDDNEDEEAVRDYFEAQGGGGDDGGAKGLDAVREIAKRLGQDMSAPALTGPMESSELTGTSLESPPQNPQNTEIRIYTGMDRWFGGLPTTMQATSGQSKGRREGRKTAMKPQQIYTLPDGSGASQVMTKYMMPALDLERALAMQKTLVKGAIFTKICNRSSKRTKRHVWISESLDFVYWAKMKKWWRVRRMPVHAVSKVSCGRLLKHSNIDFLLTVTGLDGKTLDLEVPLDGNGYTRDQWAQFFHWLIYNRRRNSERDSLAMVKAPAGLSYGCCTCKGC